MKYSPLDMSSGLCLLRKKRDLVAFIQLITCYNFNDGVEMIIKIFGERNTATNYLELLVNENINNQVYRSNLPFFIKVIVRAIRALDKRTFNFNFDESIRDFIYISLLPSRLGWKHRLLPSSEQECTLPEDDYYLLTVRDPFAWLSSMYKRPHNLSVDTEKITFSEFLRSKCRTVRREEAPFKDYDNPIEIWNIKTNAVKAFSGLRHCSVFKHEDLVLQPVKVIEEILNEVGGVQKKEEIITPDKSTKKDGRTRKDLESYIFDKKWMENYTKEDIDFVHQVLDKELYSYYY